MENNLQNSTSELVVRREKLEALKASGNNPFTITKYEVTHEAPSAIAEFEKKEAEITEDAPFTVRVAGRLISRRIMGAGCFGS